MLTWVKINIKLKYKSESLDDLFCLKYKKGVKMAKRRKKAKKKKKGKKRRRR